MMKKPKITIKINKIHFSRPKRQNLPEKQWTSRAKLGASNRWPISNQIGLLKRQNLKLTTLLKIMKMPLSEFCKLLQK